MLLDCRSRGKFFSGNSNDEFRIDSLEMVDRERIKKVKILKMEHVKDGLNKNCIKYIAYILI